MLLFFLSTVLFSILYYYIGKTFLNSPLTYYQYLVFTSVVAVIVVGAYQIYFWTEANNYFFKTRCLKTKLDDKIPFWPQWVWVYSFIYYFMIGLVIVSLNSLEEGIYLIFGGLFLLVIQCIWYIIYPCTVPPKWRKYKVNSISTRFLKFVQGCDKGRNCMPSMHCSLATYIAFLTYPILSYFSFIFAGLIAISCLFVKQHQILDIPPAILLGWIVYVIVH